MQPTLETAHFKWSLADGIGTITLDRPERKNPLTFESYDKLRDLFGALHDAPEVRVVILTGSGRNFCSGVDVHEIIGPLTRMPPSELLGFTTLTGDLVRKIREAPQIVISAIEGVCAGAGACLAMASDLRVGARGCRVAFLFVQVGLSGADMGACSLLPRIVGHGRAADLLLTGREIGDEEAHAIGFLNRLVDEGAALAAAEALGLDLATGPTLAHATTKRMLDQEWSLAVGDALDVEAAAQAACMQTSDFRVAYEAFAARAKPRFKGA